MVLERLRWHVERNGLERVRVHGAGVSDEPGELEVLLPGFDNQAAATLGAIPQRYGPHVQRLGTAPIVRLDEALDAGDRTPLTVKMDVEGFESRALAGMSGLLARRRPAVIIEINPELLELNGSSAEAVHDIFGEFGYRLFALDRAGFKGRFRLKLHELRRAQLRFEKDVLYVHPESAQWARAEPLIQPPGSYWRHHRNPSIAQLA